MNLYLVSRTDTIDYDEYDSFVCAAESEEQARSMPPVDEWLTNKFLRDNIIWECTNDLNNIEVTHIGKADEKYTKPTVILASFNAG